MFAGPQWIQNGKTWKAWTNPGQWNSKCYNSKTRNVISFSSFHHTDSQHGAYWTGIDARTLSRLHPQSHIFVNFINLDHTRKKNETNLLFKRKEMRTLTLVVKKIMLNFSKKLSLGVFLWYISWTEFNRIVYPFFKNNLNLKNVNNLTRIWSFSGLGLPKNRSILTHS